MVRKGIDRDDSRVIGQSKIDLHKLEHDKKPMALFNKKECVGFLLYYG